MSALCPPCCAIVVQHKAHGNNAMTPVNVSAARLPSLARERSALRQKLLSQQELTVDERKKLDELSDTLIESLCNLVSGLDHQMRMFVRRSRFG